MRALRKNDNYEQKAGTVEQAAARYSLGRNTIRKLADEAGAVVKIGKCVRVNFTVMDRYFDELAAGRGNV